MTPTLFLCLLALSIVYCMPPVKNLAGPPSEFALHRTPNPATVETIARSASVNLWFTNSGNGILSTTTFPQDGVEEFVLSYASPISDSTKIELLREGKPIPSGQISIVQGKYEVGDGADEGLQITTYIVTGCKTSTYYTFNVYKKEGFTQDDENLLASLIANPRPDAVLTFINNDGIKIHTHLQTYQIKVGTKLGLNSFILNENKDENLRGEPINIDHANMEVHFPDGQITNIQMKDDGLSGDYLADDGVYGANFEAKVPGDYILQATVDGTFSTQIPFQRSTQHIIEVSPATLELKGTASMRVIDTKRVGINIDLVNADNQPKIRAYAEVYGQNKAGTVVPACWIGGIVTPTNGAVELVLDLNWLAQAGLTGPLTIENVLINDVNTNFLVANHLGAIKVSKSIIKKFLFSAEQNITEEMRFGVNPLPKRRANRVGRNGATIPTLLMLPGYCTDMNPFESSSHIFPDALFPVQKGNFGHDEYALIMNGHAEKAEMDAFSIIGHSQGGLVGTHLLNFYWSGLANAGKDGRILQSVASPYQGSTAAGSSANLGKIFGVGCGSSTDLSRDGAANWLQGISSETRKHVHFYSVTYEQGKFFGDWCSLPMNLILEWPNDGITELKYAKLPGAVDMGNVEKWCHSVEMTYPPACADERRNTEMNKLAAR